MDPDVPINLVRRKRKKAMHCTLQSAKKTSRSKIFVTGCKNLEKEGLLNTEKHLIINLVYKTEVNRQTTKLSFDKEKAVKAVIYIALYIGNEYSSLVKLKKLMKLQNKIETSHINKPSVSPGIVI